MNRMIVRKNLTRSFARIVPFLVVGAFALDGSARAEPVRTNYSTVDLVSEQASLPVDGGTVTVGLYIAPNPTWHAYWINPGDAGLPATVRWNLPDGFLASELQFPAPHVIPFGEMVTYGFEEPILLLADIAVSRDRRATRWICKARRAGSSVTTNCASRKRLRSH